MYEVAEGVFDNPRWRAAGHHRRAQLADRSERSSPRRSTPTAPLGLETANTEDTISLGFGLMYGE